MLLSVWLTPRAGPVTVPVASQPPSATKQRSVPPVASVAASATSRDAGVVQREDPLTEAMCPNGMLYVAVQQCARVERDCEDGAAEACRMYSENYRCVGGKTPLSVCVDRFEYPNLEGVLPAMMLSFTEAAAACSAEGKRLCREAEWTAACEGPQHQPFTTGIQLEAKSCGLGRTAKKPDRTVLWDPQRTRDEVARLDFRSASGSGHGCPSASGVADLLGNIQEWVLSSMPGYEAALKGGHFGQATAVCRNVLNVKHPEIRLPHVGFRCCRDPLVRPAVP